MNNKTKIILLLVINGLLLFSITSSCMSIHYSKLYIKISECELIYSDYHIVGNVIESSKYPEFKEKYTNCLQDYCNNLLWFELPDDICNKNRTIKQEIAEMY